MKYISLYWFRTDGQAVLITTLLIAKEPFVIDLKVAAFSTSFGNSITRPFATSAV